MKTYAAASILFLLPAALGQTKVGTSVGQFLLIEPSARIAGMGNAGVTMYGEIQASYYNPASLGHIINNGVQLTRSFWLADIKYDHVAVAIAWRGFGNFSLSVTSLNSGEIEVRTVDQPLGTGELYTVSDLSIGLGYGRMISDRFSAGVQVNYVTERIWHSSMAAFALNVGTLYRVSPDGFHIGASISNFGTRGRFDGRDLRIQYDRNPDVHGDNSGLPASQFTEDFPLPIIFRVGFGYPLTFDEANTLRLVIDAFHPSDNTEAVSIGAEWVFENTFFLRGGYQNLFQQDSELGLTAGAGLQSDMLGTPLRFDYAWANHERLGATQRFTLGIDF